MWRRCVPRGSSNSRCNFPIKGRILRHEHRTDFLDRCIQTLETAFTQLAQYEPGDDYGEGFAETTLKLLPGFIDDAKELVGVIAEAFDE